MYSDEICAGGGSGAPKRRSFLVLTAGALGAVGLAAASWPFINSLGPAADQRGLRYTDLIPLLDFEPGDRKSFLVRGLGLVFVSHRTAAEIAAAKAGDSTELKDPEPDSTRARRDDWLIVLGTCTYRGCWVGGQSEDVIRYGRTSLMVEPLKLDRGAFGGWKCDCCGSQYDTSGRVRSGPAPSNLVVPEHRFAADGTLEVFWWRS